MKPSKPLSDNLTGPRYWRSLDELQDTAEFKNWVHREFPQGASELEGVNRRHFLRIMGASFAAAGVGLAGCRRPEQYIAPYARQTGDGVPEATIPGLPVHFTTSFPDAVDNLPLVVETHQNRPTHIEGNRDYAPYGGGIHGFASASVLDLYDPDRMTSASRGTQRLTRSGARDALQALAAGFVATGGQELAFLATPSTSPTRRRLVAALQSRFPRAVWAEYEPMPRDTADRAASEVFGESVRPVFHLGRARKILSLDSDFLNKEGGSIALARGFAAGRRVANAEEAQRMNRLYAVESAFTLTGAMADHRLRLGASEMGAFAALLVAELLEALGTDASFAASLRSRAGSLPLDAQWIPECVRDLIAHRGEAVVLAGSHLPAAVHQLVVMANELLEARNRTVEYLSVPAPQGASLAELATAMREGRVKSLVILGGNPVYNAPADLDFAGLLRGLEEVVRCGYHHDETSLEAGARGGLNLPYTHYLESWGDGRTFDGTFVPVQPMILPLFGGCWQENEILALLAGLSETDPYAVALATFREAFGGTDKDYRRFLSVGFQSGSAFSALGAAPSLARIKTAVSSAELSAPGLHGENLEVRLAKDDSVGDGSFANNGWLQECPDPMTKLAWDNAIFVSPRLAEEVLKYDLKDGSFLIGGGIAKKPIRVKRGAEIAPLAEVTVDGVTVRGPVHIMPGLADWSLVMPLGYGRTRVGRVGKGAGFNAYPMARVAGFVRTGAKIRLTGETYRLANTQEHWSMEGRAIVREANLDEQLSNYEELAHDHGHVSPWVETIGMESHSPAIYGKDKDKSLAYKSLTTPRGGSLYETPDFNEPPPNVKVWKSEEAMARFIPEQQWGMTIDLNTCTGCNSCIVACQSENNIPIVGKDQVIRGREMHWIRLDRYYSSGDLKANYTSLPTDPQTSLLPVACVHCEMAPCEQVCPVNATVHDTQGLNVMAYNRCVGTRYCANNCPYKVRRFNFFDYNKRATDEFYLGPVGTDQYKTTGGQLKAMQANPDVTVRMRGVMEKCTYCVQRIQQAKIAQKVKARDSNDIHVPDGVIRMACQAACPTEAITFGDISNPDTEVYRAKMNNRNYSLLGYLNVRPRTTYLARLRNPNPKMPDAYAVPHSRAEYKQA
jgi:MoCo/4Fe-4S cofactor protein with predicted Tat translocation signal